MTDFETKNKKDDTESFESIRELGQGISGTVYLVRDLKYSGKKVALKTINNTLDASLQMDKRLLGEFSIYKDLQHKNIVEAYRWVTYHGLKGYTMEYVEGSTLDKFIGVHKIDIQRIRKFIVSLLSAIGAVHKLKDPNKPDSHVLHRDIKLENIMIRKHDDELKLIDFGFAQRFDQKLTQQGTKLGTLPYTPPEYLLNLSPYQVASDIYQCGVVLWELLSNQRREHLLQVSKKEIEQEAKNWARENGVQSELKIAAKEQEILNNKIVAQLIKTKFSLPPIQLSDPHETERYNKIIARATSYKVENRYQTTQEFIDAVNGVVQINIPKMLLAAMLFCLIVALGVANVFYGFFK